ncbi:Aspartyl/glutamyl-tRNA(Asn/Gln) amidotransferase subunit B [Bienertia sinuspersici]
MYGHAESFFIAELKFLGALWRNWDIQMFVMLSLSLQFFLIWFASLRKRVSKQILHVSIWLAYLLADWAAVFAIGLIHYKGCQEQINSDKLYSFWAPFLVVHLGGPDTITALTMEDNELWRRHLLQFIAQSVGTCNILYHNSPPDPLLWLPVALIFICGVIKYGERVWALYCASLDKFRRSNLRDPDPGPNYAMFMEQYAQKVEDGFPTRIETIEEPELEQDLHNFEVRKKVQLEGVQVVKDAYRLYQRFKGLIVDFEYSFRDRKKSVQYFLSLETDDAFRVVETELNFLYEAFYTKATILHRRAAYIIRCCCLCFGLISFGVFFFWEKYGHNSKKLHIASRDVNISYTLLLGAIVLDIISILALVFSNWTVAFLVKDSQKNKRRSLFNDVTDKVLSFGSRWLSAYPEAPQVSQFIFRPWSNSICRFSLLEYYLDQRPSKTNKILDLLGIKLFFDDLRYVDTYKMNENMRKLIFQELKKKSEQADDPEMAKILCQARGNWVLKSYVVDGKVLELNNWIMEVEYDESLLLWHIATEVCYNMDSLRYDENRTISKVLSDYMVYLLVMKPMMISNVAGISDLRLRDTEAEALRYIQGTIADAEDHDPVSSLLTPLNLLCRSMTNILIRDDVKPRDVKGSRSKSVLFEACRLANRLMKLPNKWELMSRVWVELLCYAASHCRPTGHVQQVSRGGELISVVWFLMTHLGVGENFHLDDGPTRTKLFVDK